MNLSLMASERVLYREYRRTCIYGEKCTKLDMGKTKIIVNEYAKIKIRKRNKRGKGRFRSIRRK